MTDLISHDFEGDLEDAVEFTPDFDVAGEDSVCDSGGVPIDIYLFRKSLDDGLGIFLERREKYGSHIENAKRFPIEYISGLYMKCVRLIRMIERGERPDDDTILDTANYCHMIRSVHE